MTIKKLTLIMAILATGTAAVHAQTDTVKVINNATYITVERIGDQTTVKAVIPDSGNSASFDLYTYQVNTNDNAADRYNPGLGNMMLELPFMRQTTKSGTATKKAKPCITVLKYMYWGWNFNYDGKAGLKNSFELGIADFVGVDWHTSRKTTLGIGLGFGLNRITSRDNRLFVRTGDMLSMTDAPAGSVPDFARWDILRFQIPLMYSQKLGNSFGFALAPIINFNTYATATNRYTLDGIRYTEKIKGLNPRLLTVDLMATVGIVNGLGIYAKWSPMTSMQSAYGPTFRNFSIGANFNF